MSERHRTLFAVDLAEERTARRIGQRARGAGSGATSDVRRHRPMVVAAATACMGVLAGWGLSPEPVETGRGALALPHEGAKLECSTCHVEGAAPAAACKGCHGPHASVRAGHRALAADGKLGCARCHDVHGADEGVRFSAPEGAAVRYGVGRQAALDLRLPSEHDVTVPLIPISRCAGACHDPTRGDDPITRCVSPESPLSMCFDEHQEWSAVAPARAGGVCSAQHGNDRFAAWEAAREAAARQPSVPAAPSRGAAVWWIGSGAGGAAIGLLAYAGATWLRRRRRPEKRASAIQPAARVRLPQIDTNTCLGCYACVDACPYDVLQVERYVALVARPEACCGLTLCEQVCPNGSLVITDGEPIGDRPRIDAELQAAPGIYLAGDVTGLPLIKNAIAQGARAVESIAAALPRHDAPLDVLIVGAGPAGISAALKAKELGLRYEVMEQGSVAQSIRSFPRGKLVFNQPLELPVAGDLWLADATKEELLAKWLRVIRQEKLVIHEGERFTDVVRDGDTLVIHGARGEDATAYRAARLLLAVGLRGTPRKLAAPLSPEAESRVFYHLADARSVAGQRVLVIGLGDVAMETAIALSRQPGTRVTVAHRGDGFTRGKSRNIEELRRLAAVDRVELVFGATVTAVDQHAASLSTKDGARRIEVDAIFVMIGNEPPRALLERAGVSVGPAS